MNRLFEILATIGGIVLVLVGGALLLTAEQAKDSFIGLGCFLLIIAWQVGTLSGRTQAQNDLLAHILKDMKD